MAPLVMALDRHEQRREAGVPTVSVLAGPTPLAMHCWRHWAESRRRQVVDVESMVVAEIVRCWTERLGHVQNVRDGAVAYLACRLGVPAVPLGQRLAAQTVHDLCSFLEHHLPDDFGGPDTACRWVLERSVEGRLPASEKWAPALDRILAAHTHSPARLLAALGALLPPQARPTLLIACHQTAPNAVSWLDAAARSVGQLAMAVPWLSVGLAAPADSVAAYLDQTSESRFKAILRETVLRIEEEKERKPAFLDGNKTSPPVPSPAKIGDVEKPVAPGPTEKDRARSEAERFLFARLESLPPTAGLFELNQPLNFSFGINPAEPDLVCLPLRLAIEIDGYYHFQDPDAYRRDRRKDLELQRHGYLVLRFLAEDVTARLEEILDTILEVVAWRRGRIQPPDGKETR